MQNIRFPHARPPYHIEGMPDLTKVMYPLSIGEDCDYEELDIELVEGSDNKIPYNLYELFPKGSKISFDVKADIIEGYFEIYGQSYFEDFYGIVTPYNGSFSNLKLEGLRLPEGLPDPEYFIQSYFERASQSTNPPMNEASVYSVIEVSFKLPSDLELSNQTKIFTKEDENINQGDTVVDLSNRPFKLILGNGQEASMGLLDTSRLYIEDGYFGLLFLSKDTDLLTRVGNSFTLESNL